MPKWARKRHERTSFRANTSPAAGNFLLWDSWGALINDPLIGAVFIDTVHDLLSSGYQDKERISLRHPERPVGWSITAPHSFVYRSGADVTVSQPNKRLKVLKVRNPKVEAPLTHIVSFGLRIGRANGHVPVIVEEVFPGPDPGPPRGDLRKTGRVFFDPDHPGGEKVLDEDL